MSRDELRKKYQVSDGEFKTIKKSFDEVAYDLWYYSSELSIPKIREYEKGAAEKERYEREQRQVESEHQRKGIIARSFTSPRNVKKDVFLISDLERARERVEAIRTKEEKFEYICNAHRLNSKSVFQDLLADKDSENAADAYRAYEYAKTSSAFKEIFSKW